MYNRRDFLRSVSILGSACLMLPGSKVFGFDNQKVRLGFIGVGSRGRLLLEIAAKRQDVEIVAVCDIVKSKVDNISGFLNGLGKDSPKTYSDNEKDYQRLLKQEDVDAVVISTPWELHFQMTIDSMHAGKYVGCEVIAATTIKEMWKLVETSEKTKVNYMILENVCYRRDIMAVMNMVRQNIFGELIHLQGGYQHDLRKLFLTGRNSNYSGKIEELENGKFTGERWRTEHFKNRNGDLYPTHGIGPLAMILNINRGNRFTELVSFASKSKGLNDFVIKNGGENLKLANVDFKEGDVITTMIKCENGETVFLQFDTTLPRPYSLGFRIQGTNGIFMDINNSIYIEGKSTNPDQWDSAQKLLNEYDHPLWKKHQSLAIGSGHGGMDFFVINSFVESVKRNKTAPFDIYDAVTWSAITPLSEKSISKGGKLVKFPDFTKGKWRVRKNEFGITDEY